MTSCSVKRKLLWYLHSSSGLEVLTPATHLTKRISAASVLLLLSRFLILMKQQILLLPYTVLGTL